MKFKLGKYKFDIYSALLMLVLAYSFTVSIQGITPFAIHRICVFAMIPCTAIIVLSQLTRKDLAVLLSAVVMLAYTCGITKNLNRNFNDNMQIISVLLWLILLSKREFRLRFLETFERNRAVVRLFLYVSIFLILSSLLLPSSYESVWGKDTYFVGLARKAHPMASVTCVIIALLLLYTANDGFRITDAFILLALVFVIFMTGARTFIIPAAVLVAFYIRDRIRSRIERFCIYGFAIVIVAVILVNSSMLEKFKHVFSNPMEKSVLWTFTSGRSGFWVTDIQAFLAGDLLTMLLGYGFDYIYTLNYQATGLSIWAHNDFINLLVCAGLNGLLAYIYVLMGCLLKLCKYQDLFRKVLLLLYVLFPALVNGFYGYQHFSLSFVILSLCYTKIEYEKQRAKSNT